MTTTEYVCVCVCVYRMKILTQGNMCDDTAKYERCQKRQRDDEAVEKAVIAFAHTVPHPWTVVVKSLWGGNQDNNQRLDTYLQHVNSVANIQ